LDRAQIIKEIAAAVGLLINPMKSLTAWLLIIFFIAVLPANINASIKEIDYQTDTKTGSGAQYLWFRVPLQLFFIIWVYFFWNLSWVKLLPSAAFPGSYWKESKYRVGRRVQSK
jgi:uncharacterized membrane protein